jgi:hypothetical protein
VIKRLFAVVGAAALVGMLGLFVVGTVFAQGPTPTPAAPQAPWGRAWGGVCRGAGVISDAVAKLLGMTQDQIYAERAAGKTLSDIAKEKGITDQQLIDAMLASRQEAIEQAVKDGRITQEQADWMIARMKAMAPFQVTNPFAPGAGCGGFGGMRGGRGPWGQGAPARSGSSSS